MASLAPIEPRKANNPVGALRGSRQLHLAIRVLPKTSRNYVLPPVDTEGRPVPSDRRGRSVVVICRAMENHPWQQRARAAGLTQRTLSKLLGHAEITVSRQLRGHWESGIPAHVTAAILAWEIMSDDQRAKWIAAVEVARLVKGRKKRAGLDRPKS